jgi:hypothetical protein
MTISRPKLPPTDPVVMFLDPFNNNYVLSDVLLLIYDLLGLNGSGSIYYGYILLLIDSDRKFSGFLGTAFDGCLHDCLQEGLLTDVVVEENALEKSTCLERSHSCLGGEVNGLEVNQVHLPIIDAQSEDELAAKGKNPKERLHVFFDFLT